MNLSFYFLTFLCCTSYQTVGMLVCPTSSKGVALSLYIQKCVLRSPEKLTLFDLLGECTSNAIQNSLHTPAP